MPPNGQTTPESFADLLSGKIIPAVTEKIKTILKEAPTKFYDVFRQTPAGPVQQQISLPQALAELTDQLKIQNQLTWQNIQASEKLSRELEENRKFGAKVLKRQKQQESDDDDD